MNCNDQNNVFMYAESKCDLGCYLVVSKAKSLHENDCGNLGGSMDGKAGLKWLEDRDQKPRIARGFWLLQAAAHGSCADPWGLAADGALPGAQTLLRYWSGVIPKRRLKSLKK